jgi:hypothetical protein
MGFRVLIVGGSGQVGSGVVRALLAASACTEVVMVNRRTIPLAADARLRQVIMDTGAENFGGEIAALARTRLEKHDPLYAASCIGVGKGATRTSGSLRLGWSARLRVAASQRMSNDSDFFRQPGAALRVGFVMLVSWAKRKKRYGASDLIV